MKIAVPIRQQQFSSHFGGADGFALYQVDEGTQEVAERRDESPPDHRRGAFPMWLEKQQATVVLAGDIGARALSIFARHDITVVAGVEGADPDTLVRQYLAGSLESNREPCRGRGLHDCGHHHE